MSFLNRIKRIAKYMSFEEFRFDLEYLWFRLQERKYIAAKTPELREIDDLVRNDEKCDMNAKGRLVSIIIPSKDNPKLLSDLLKSVREKEGSLHPEIIVVDNGSSNENRRIYEEIAKREEASYLYNKEKFNFSKMCNEGSKQATGDLLLFLNDDMKVISDNFLEPLAKTVLEEKSGAVGSLLLFENNAIQHAGLSGGFFPMHLHYEESEESIDYLPKLYQAPEVTGACLMVRKEVFQLVGGFDEELPNHYNDVDLCLKLLEAGYFNMVRKDVKLYHLESFTRGKGIDMTKEERKAWIKAHEYLLSRHYDTLLVV